MTLEYLIALIFAGLSVWGFALWRRALKDLETMKQEVRSLRRYGSEFVANVSHELKTPLTSIKGYTETLKNGAIRDPKTALEFLDRIESNTDRLSLLINDIMDLSKIESPNLHMEIQEVNVSQVLKSLQEDFAFKLSQRRQVLAVRNEVEFLQADKRLFEQAFSNLVDNAHRYCPDGALIEVVGTLQGDDWAQFDIVDNGPGISPEDLPRIFERFYRADKSRTRLLGGTGLGLAIVKHILISHGGEVKAASQRGRGATFTMRFPRRASS